MVSWVKIKALHSAGRTQCFRKFVVSTGKDTMFQEVCGYHVYFIMSIVLYNKVS
jgi:hypothetical protein